MVTDNIEKQETINGDKPLSKLPAYGFHAVLALSFLGALIAYGAPIHLHGYARGMYILLWACDDAIRVFAQQLKISYDEANIILFVFLSPLLTLVSCMGIKIKNLAVKNTIYYGVLSIGLVLLYWLTQLYLVCAFERFGELKHIDTMKLLKNILLILSSTLLVAAGWMVYNFYSVDSQVPDKTTVKQVKRRVEQITNHKKGYIVFVDHGRPSKEHRLSIYDMHKRRR